MTRDKQLRDISLDKVVEKRRLDQALNAKEFAVLAGISYSAARAWFRMSGFPVFNGVVFWNDFIQWRRGQVKSHSENISTDEKATCDGQRAAHLSGLPSRAAKILAEAS